MFDWVRQFYEWMWERLTDAGEALWQEIAERFPNYVPDFGQYSQYLSAANQWFPLSEGVVMAAAFFGFLLVFVVGKMVLKLIPGVG